MTMPNPLTEAVVQYRRAEMRHRRSNPNNDPRLRPHLWMVVVDPIDILTKARRAEFNTTDE